MITAVFTFGFTFYQWIQENTIKRSGTIQISMPQITVEGYQSIKNNDRYQIIGSTETVGYADETYTSNNETFHNLRYIQNINDELRYSLILKDGRWPASANEIMVSYTDFVNAQNKDASLAIGKTIQLNTGQTFTITYPSTDDPTITEAQVVIDQQTSYTIVGIYITDNNSVFGHYPEWAYYTAGGTPIAMSVRYDYKAPNSKMIKETKALYSQIKTGSGNLQVNEDYLRTLGISTSTYFLQVIGAISLAASIVLALILVAGVSLIRNAFALAAGERVRQLGMLSSIGATKSQKKWILYSEGIELAIIGIVVGSLSGFIGMKLTFYILNRNFSVFNALGLHAVLPWYGLVGIALLAGLTVYLSMRSPAHRASKTSPIESIRQNQEFKISRSGRRTNRFVLRVFGIEGEIARKYMARNKKRYRPTIISLTLSIVLFLVAMNVTGMLNQTIDLESNSGTADLQVNQYVNKENFAQLDQWRTTLKESGYFSEISLFLSPDSFFANLTPEQTNSEMSQQSYSSETDVQFNYQSTLYIVDDTTYQSILQKNNLSLTTGVLIYDHYDQIVNDKREVGHTTKLKNGDTVKMVSLMAETPQTLDYPVAAVIENPPLGVNQLYQTRQFYIILSETQAAPFLATIQNDWFITTRIYLNLADTQDEAQAVSLLEKLNSSDVSGNSSYLYNKIAENRRIQQTITVVTIFVSGFILLISLICVVNIINTMANNIRQRRKEFAILRSVGMTSHGINKMLYFESCMYGIKTILFSVPISLVLNYWIYTQFAKSTTLNYGIGPLYYVAVILMVMLLVTITMFYVSRRVKKENIIETIKDESM